MDQFFRIDQSAAIKTVTLKVDNLNKLADYYELLGLKRLVETEQKITMGSPRSNYPLLILKKVSNPSPRRKVTGLFHTAFLLPERKDLGNVLYHLLSQQIPLDGASDHGYSEAIYLHDPEGNGIEIYSDKPKAEWDIRPSGRIAGITIEMDADGVLAARDQSAPSLFPEKTKIGHVHLSVADLDETQTFYEKILGMDLKDEFGQQARFFAANGYHHHIGANIWLGKNLPKPSETDLGLETFSLVVSSKEEWWIIRKRLESFEVNIIETSENALAVMDPNGIKIEIRNDLTDMTM